MARAEPMPLEELQKVQRAIGNAYDKMESGEYEIGVKIFEEQLPLLDTEFRRFESAEPIDAYAYAKRLDPSALREMLHLMRVQTLDSLKGIVMPHPHFMIIRHLYGYVLSALIRAYGEMKQKEKAFEISKRALVVDERNDEIWANLGILQANNGDIRSSVKSFRNAVRYSPHDKTWWKNLGTSCRLRRRNEELAIINDTLGKMDSLSTELDSLPKELTEKLLSATIQKVIALHGFLDLCLFGGDTSAAEDAAKTLLKPDPRDTEAYLKLARVRALDQKYDDAVSLLKTALKQNNKRADIHGELGRILMIKGNYKDACKEFEEALKSDRENDELKYLRVLTKESKGPVTSTINIVSACGNRESKIHHGVKVPLGCRILEVLHRISLSNLTGVGDASRPGSGNFGTKTTYFSRPKSDDADFSLISADPLPVLDFTDIIGREPGEFYVTYSTALSEIPYSKVPYRPKDSLMSIPVHHCTICVSTADATLPEVAINATLPSLLSYLHLDIAEKEGETDGKK